MFENELNTWLQIQIANGVFIDASLVGVQETKRRGKAVITVQIAGEAKEKWAALWDSPEGIQWMYLLPIDRKLTYDFGDQNWHYYDFAKRIVAPIDLANQYPQIKVWFDLRNLPIEVSGNTCYLYCNEIDPVHQQLVDNLQGVITIENRPE